MLSKSVIPRIKTPPKRLKLYLVWILILTVLFYILYICQNKDYEEYTQKHVPKNIMSIFSERWFNKYIVDTEGCQIPYMDPMDYGIVKFLEKPKEIVCNKGKPALYDFNLTSVFLLRKSFPDYNIKNESLLECCYQDVRRRKPTLHESDTQYDINDKCISIRESKKIKEDMILVTCEYNSMKIYRDMFWFVHPKFNKTQVIDFESPPLNILVIGLDSVSRLNLHRQLPKTVKYLQEIDAVEFLGYTRIGYCTFDNLIPVLTGKSEEELKTSCWNKTDHFDKCIFLWNMYKDAGYVTSFGEDSSWMGLFNFNVKGFINQTTDYAYGYFNKIAEDKIGNSHNYNVYECIGAREVHKDFIKYIKTVNKMLRSNCAPHFAFYWGSTLTHDYLNKPNLGDELYFNLFKSLKEMGHLDNTVLVFMSDHGIRWGGISKTTQGKLEGKLPFLFIRLPQPFRTDFKAAYNNLKENAYRFTIPYDVHETLKDLLTPYNLNETFLNFRPFSSSRGISLFNKIPKTRSCKTLSLGDYYCPCKKNPFDIFKFF